MSLSRKVAKELCNASEMSLFDESSMHGVKALSDKQIESKIQTAKKLRDKYTALHKEQLKKAQSIKDDGSGFEAAVQTARKVKIFEDCIYRFEATLKKRIEHANRPKKPLGRPPGSKNKKTIAKKQSSKKAKGRPGKKKRR